MEAMEANNIFSSLLNNKSLEVIKRKSPKKESKSQGKKFKYIKTNLYLNDYNYYFKNAIKMNKLREEKIKENKIKNENARKINILPKMLYFNKYLNQNSKPPIYKNNNKTKTISKFKIYSKNIVKNNPHPVCMSSDNRGYNYNKIENAIMAQNIEEKNKSHIKKTIKAFDDLIHYVDNFKLQNKKIKLRINTNNDIMTPNDIINYGENSDDNYNDEEEEEDVNIEKYNFDEYKKLYKKEKLLKKNSSSQDQLKTFNNQSILKNNYSEDFKRRNDIYITASNDIIKKTKNIKENKSNPQIIMKQKQSSLKSFNPKTEGKKKPQKKKLIINNMAIISDDMLMTKIKDIKRDFREGLYFNEYGKFKFTELGLSYPESFDKYKKIPDYKGDDIEEKEVFKYRSVITNPKYNYTNIGSFNEKFNHDLSDISTYYGKETSKGRFIRNPLISMFSKYIPNYEKYKDLKFIENRYICRNRYKYRLKPLVTAQKNNFDKLGNVVYRKEHQKDNFSNP